MIDIEGRETAMSDVYARRKFLADEAARMNQAILQEGFYIPGSRGQRVLNPLCNARLQLMAELRRLDAKNLPRDEDPLADFIEADS